LNEQQSVKMSSMSVTDENHREIIRQRRDAATAEARELLQRFNPHILEWRRGDKLRKLGSIEYESQHWRVRTYLLGGKPVGYLIKQKESSVDFIGAIISKELESHEPADTTRSEHALEC